MTDTVRLNTLKPGDKCLIMEIKATGITGQRLMDLGLIPGVVIEVVRNAPLVGLFNCLSGITTLASAIQRQEKLG